jgi:hypothetical protein
MMKTGLVATPQPPIPNNALEQNGESISEKTLTADGHWCRRISHWLLLTQLVSLGA